MKPMRITETQRLNALAQAADLQELLAPVLQRDDLDAEQFEHAAELYSQTVVVKARLTSMEGRTV